MKKDGHQKARSTHQDLSCLWFALYLEKEMAQLLGTGHLLF